MLLGPAQRHRLGLSVCRVKQKLEPSEKRSAILRCFPPLGDTMLSSPQLPLFIFLHDQKGGPSESGSCCHKRWDSHECARWHVAADIRGC